jgi:hypothetical protein
MQRPDARDLGGDPCRPDDADNRLEQQLAGAAQQPRAHAARV